MFWPCLPVSAMSVCVRVCFCLCAHRVKITRGSPAVNHTVVTRSRWPIKKILSKYPIRAVESSPLHTFCRHRRLFTAPPPSLHHRERQGSFHLHARTRTHERIGRKCARAHTHERSTPYYSLLICRALIETPLSLSHTCFPSLIISQGAFGGDGGRKREIQRLLWPTGWTFTDQTGFDLKPVGVCFHQWGGKKKKKTMPGAKWVNQYVHPPRPIWCHRWPDQVLIKHSLGNTLDFSSWPFVDNKSVSPTSHRCS